MQGLYSGLAAISKRHYFIWVAGGEREVIYKNYGHQVRVKTVRVFISNSKVLFNFEVLFVVIKLSTLESEINDKVGPLDLPEIISAASYTNV